ncbi:MAG: hypothetical protein OXL34_09265 [Gemmatimonadota bacterium]|nr:hypothetical protein [Gemmatimonadota bacterium]
MSIDRHMLLVLGRTDHCGRNEHRERHRCDILHALQGSPEEMARQDLGHGQTHEQQQRPASGDGAGGDHTPLKRPPDATAFPAGLQ